MNSNSQLLTYIQGCLNQTTIQESQANLVRYSQKNTFLSQLLQLIPNQPSHILIMIISTLKNYLESNYAGQTISQQQKTILRENILNFFYEIKDVAPAVNLYKQIVYVIIKNDFQIFTTVFYTLLENDLSSSISASLYFCNQVSTYYEWLTYTQRGPMQQFICAFYSKLENILEQILQNYNEQTRVLLNEILQMFYRSFHLEVPEYLRNFQNMEKWILYIRTVLQAPLDNYPHNHLYASKIYVKLFSMYCRDGTDGKNYRGWAQQFRQRYAESIYNEVVKYIVNPIPDEDAVANMVNCLCTVVNNPDLQHLIKEDHCQALIYKHLLPFMYSSKQDDSFFTSDGLQYIRRQEDLKSHPFREISLQLLKSISIHLSYGEKKELVKIVEHSANILTGNSSDQQKQVCLMVLTNLNKQLMRDQYLRQNFQNLVNQCFIPIIQNSNPILSARAIKLLEEYLQMITLSTQTVRELLSLLYQKMVSGSLVVKFYSMVTFVKLLSNKAALEQTRPHFQNILDLYVKMLECMNHEKLISSIQGIVRSFSHQIGLYAKDLCTHLFSLFHNYHDKDAQQQGEQAETNIKATAALSTIKQILESQLSADSYYLISESAQILLQNLNEYDDYFQQIISLFNVLIYKCGNIANFQFPYLLFLKLLNNDNSILNACQNDNWKKIVFETEVADVDYTQTILSVLKNLIQKMPENILHRYQYPTNPQLLLCLIENKKISAEILPQINTASIDQQWSLILQSFTACVYGIGELPNLQKLKMLNGVSLQPWIQYKMDLNVIKRILFLMEEEQADDNFYSENTMQMLEELANQNEDDDDDDEDFYVTDGGAYNHLYDSPYNPSQDRVLLVTKLKQISSNDLNYLLAQLKPKNSTRLQTLMMG